MSKLSFTRYYTLKQTDPNRWVLVRYVNVAAGAGMEFKGVCYMMHHGQRIFYSKGAMMHTLDDCKRLGAKLVKQWPPTEEEA